MLDLLTLNLHIQHKAHLSIGGLLYGTIFAFVAALIVAYLNYGMIKKK